MVEYTVTHSIDLIVSNPNVRPTLKGRTLTVEDIVIVMASHSGSIFLWQPS
jgi:hypothetical protein